MGEDPVGGSSNHAEFDASIDGNLIKVVDLNRGGRSVTNDAEWVVTELARRYGPLGDRWIQYRDSLGNWDWLLVKNGQFAGFAPGERSA